MEELESININLEVKITSEGDAATVHIPEEIRITERLASSLAQAVAARNLTLKHWAISEVQKKELLGLSNVVVQEAEGE